LNNIASIHFTRGDYVGAEKYWREAIASYPKYKQAYYRLALTQTKLGKWNEAAETLSLVGDGKVPDPNRSRLKGILLLRENKPEAATQYFRNCIKMNPRDWQSSMYLGVAFSMMGHAEKAYRFLKMAVVERPNEPLLQLLLAGNRLGAGDDSEVQIHLDTFITKIGPRQVETYLSDIKKQFEFAHPFLADLQPLIANKIGSMARELKGVAGRLHEVPVDQTETTETVNSDVLGYADGS
jgi:tetratricopeptide (TPR) repeat protein